jgi:D-alanine transfer protein
MLRYPQIMRKSPVLAAAVWGVGGDRLLDRAIFFAAMPLGWLQNAVYRLQDHFEVIQAKRDDHKLYHLVARKPAELDWDRLFAEAGPLVKPLPEDTPDERLKQFAGDAAFLEALQRSAEWGDFELLLRVVRELHLDPLLLSMPMEYEHFERMGISAQAIDAYALRLRALADRYQVPIVDFADLGEDPRFFADHFGHPSAKGWIYFDRALDDFFHGRLVRGREPSPPGEKSLSKEPGPGISRWE